MVETMGLANSLLNYFSFEYILNEYYEIINLWLFYSYYVFQAMNRNKYK